MMVIVTEKISTHFFSVQGILAFTFSQKVNTVSGVGITVADLDREVDFFVKNLDFQKISEETQSGEAVAKLYG